MKNILTKLIALTLIAILCLGVLASCKKEEEKDNTIWVGNTAGTTGLLAKIGGPFNLGIEAAFDAYNKAGGFNGRNVALKHYDDGGLAENSVPNLEKLIKGDDVFAIVGHFGSYAVDATLDQLIDEEVPMIYAAAGNEELLNENAQTIGEKGIVPVQPLNRTEGRMLILRAFAPADKGGLGGTKVGVIANSNEASQSILGGIKAEMETLPAKHKDNVLIREISGSTTFDSAIADLKSQGCDVIVLTVIGDDFLTALTTIANNNYVCSVLTTYNNASAAVFNGTDSKMQKAYEPIFQTVALFAQAWLDISSATYFYKAETPLYNGYKFLGLATENGVPGFTEEYWGVAENIFNYANSINHDNPLGMSYDAYALAGYIAGDLFCQVLEEMERQGLELTRENYINTLESKEYKIAMADSLSFANGMRSGVQSFALTCIFDSHNLPEGATDYHAATSATVYGLMSLEDYRALLK